MQTSIATPSASAPVIFNFTEQAIRIVADDHDNPWFAATDICNVLGYANSSDALAKHCKDPGIAKRDIGVVTGKKADGTDATQQIQLTFINEGNLYRLIVKSRKQEAEKFEAWLMDEVLPSIRKTGGYAMRRPASADFSLTDLTVRLANAVVPMIKTHSLRQAYVIANHAIQADTWIDVLAHWPISLNEIDGTLPTLPGRKLPKPEASGKNPLDKLARYLRNAKHLPVPRQASKFTAEIIARLLGQGYIPRQVLLKVMHVPAAEFNLLIAEGKETGIVRELDGIEFNYAGVVYVAGGAA